MMTPEHVLDFWFREIDDAAWWRKDLAFATLILDAGKGAVALLIAMPETATWLPAAMR